MSQTLHMKISLLRRENCLFVTYSVRIEYPMVLSEFRYLIGSDPSRYVQFWSLYAIVTRVLLPYKD